MRRALRKDNKSVDTSIYEEAVDGTDHFQISFGGNAAYALGARLTVRLHVRLVRLYPGRGRRRTGGRPSDPQLTTAKATWRSVPDRSAHYGPPRKRAADLGFVPTVHCKGTDTRHLQRPIVAEAEDVQHRSGQCQRPAVHAASLYSRDLPLRSLPQVNDRDKIGSFMSRKDARTSSIHGLINTCGRRRRPTIKAQKPLSQGPSVEVQEFQESRRLSSDLLP